MTSTTMSRFRVPQIVCGLCLLAAPQVMAAEISAVPGPDDQGGMLMPMVSIAGADREAKINSAFAIGGAGSLIETIDLNFGIPVNYFVNVDFAGFEGLVDAVGSVDVEFPAPARDWNTTYQRSQTGFEMLTAGCHSLDPPTALAYVRSRYYQTQDADGRWISDPDGDLGRIRRQQDFLQRLIQRAIDLGARNPFVLKDLIETASDNVVIDQELTPQLLIHLSANFASFQPGELETYSIPADFGQVGTSSVLFVDASAADPLLALFRGAASDDPTTVGLRVVHATEMADAAGTFTNTLETAGFSVASSSAATVEPGITVRHGVDGLQAAQLVAEVLSAAGNELAGSLVLQQIDGLRGREVVVSIGTAEELSEPERSPETDSSSVSVDPTGATTADSGSEAALGAVDGSDSVVAAPEYSCS